jgi:hypothetical protein
VLLTEAGQPDLAMAARCCRPADWFIQVFGSGGCNAAKACQSGAPTTVPAATVLLIGGSVGPIEVALRTHVVVVVVVIVLSRCPARLRRRTAASPPIGITVPERNRLIDPVFVGERQRLGRLQTKPTHEDSKREGR